MDPPRPAHLLDEEAFWWCTHCGVRWLGGCLCSSRHLQPFPDQGAARAAFALGGISAVHAIELELYNEQHIDDRVDAFLYGMAARELK